MKLRWMPTANRSYEYIMTCATEFYGKTTLRKLSVAIKNAERLLLTNPYMGNREPLAEGRMFEYRSIELPSPFKLIYTIYEDAIYIADIWDTRQSPDKLVNKL